MFALAFTDKMTKNLNCRQKITETLYAPQQFVRSIITWTVIFRG